MAKMTIAMLGASGVGKTSLLTSMYQQLEDTVNQTHLQFSPDPRTSALLQQQLIRLQNSYSEVTYEPVGTVGTRDQRVFGFGIGRPGRKPTLNLEFIDYPGGWLFNRPEEVTQIIANSNVILVVIDAAALMEADGKWNELVNTPQMIISTFKTALQGVSEPRMVLFVPVKCESYVADEARARDLHDAITRTYGRLVQLFDADGLRDKVIAGITPVQTTGCLIFSRIEEKTEPERYPIFYFRKRHPTAPYAPADAEQPLRYILGFLIRLQRERRNLMTVLLDRLLQNDKPFLEAINTFSDGLKRDMPFEILQGHEWLDT